jgi:hypothetical protein
MEIDQDLEGEDEGIGRKRPGPKRTMCERRVRRPSDGSPFMMAYDGHGP